MVPATVPVSSVPTPTINSHSAQNTVNSAAKVSMKKTAPTTIMASPKEKVTPDLLNKKGII